MERRWVSVCRISSSISNFRAKLLERFQLKEWHWWRTWAEPTVFFGLYHIGDYARFLWHNGDRVVFWCGGDILNLKKSRFWKLIIPQIEADHFCENEIEQLELKRLGIESTVSPQCFDKFDDIKISYRSSQTPHVFLACHPGYEQQYGVNFIEGVASLVPEVTFHVYGINKQTIRTPHNVVYHGQVSNDQFTEEIKHYQAGLRLNDFDGFSEILAKSILMGQWPISTIYYPFIDYAKDTTTLLSLLKNLKNKKKPNLAGRIYWLDHLKKTPFLE